MEAEGCEGDDAGVAVGLGGTDEGGEEVLDEQCVTEVVDTELDLVAVVCQSGGYSHDASVADEDVEALCGCFDLICSFIDGVERS